MTDIPIIFSASMILALFDGRKSMTRRLAWRSETDQSKMSFLCEGERPNPLARKAKGFGVQMGGEYWLRPTPWVGVKPGDRLWVRETWRPHGDAPLSECTGPEDVLCAATADEAALAIHKWRPPIHMPRWASRLTLIVTATKIERLQEISDADAMAEGMTQGKHEIINIPQIKFSTLWQTLHGPGSWNANPEVAALTFEVHKTNIDAMPQENAA